jgi:hypothetical protein
MEKFRILLIVAALCSTQSVFAAEEDMLSSKPCAMVAAACTKAGFPKGKTFWMGCMKPVLLNKSVKKVTVDAATAKACRMDKIDELKKELAEFEGATP